MTRGKTIKYTVIAAAVSKVSSALLQFGSLPVAKHVLEIEAFGVYSMVSLSIFVLSMLQLGVGPALSRCLAEAVARGQRKEQVHYYLSGAVLTFAIVLVGAAIFASIVWLVPTELIFGDKFFEYRELLRSALLLGIGLTALEVILWHTDASFEGYLEGYIMHYALSISNLIGAVIIVVGIRYFPTIEFLLIAIALPKIGSRIVGTAILWYKRPFLIQSWTKFRKSTFVEFLKDGVSFSAATNLVYLVEVFICALMIGHLLGPADVAVYNIFATITTVFTGMILMVARPFWTASIDAKERQDHQWIRTATIRFYLYFSGLMLVTGLLAIIAGPAAAKLLYGSDIEMNRTLFACHFLFLTMVGTRAIGMYIMMGLGRLSETVLPIIVGLVPGLFFAVFGLHNFGVAGMFLGLALGVAIYPAWKLTLEILQDVKSCPSIATAANSLSLKTMKIATHNDT